MARRCGQYLSSSEECGRKAAKGDIGSGFVCNKGSERIYIQSAWRMSDAEKMEQEKRSLRLVDDSFRKLLIVGEHTKQWSDENGIQIMSIYDFLLDWSSTEKHG